MPHCRYFTRITLYLLLKSRHKCLDYDPEFRRKPLKGMHQSAGVLLEISRVMATDFVR